VVCLQNAKSVLHSFYFRHAAPAPPVAGMSGEPSSSDVHHDNYPSVGRTRQKGDSVALEAIRIATGSNFDS
jgi:hypothetical protein